MAISGEIDLRFMADALTEARRGLATGGIPIGAVIVVDGKIIGRGYNQRVQKSSPILHAEMDAFDNAGRLPLDVYTRATLYTTLSPCPMCAGTSVLYQIPRIVIGENRTLGDFTLGEDWLRQQGVDLVNLDLSECYGLMAAFIRSSPQLWNEDRGRRD